LANLQLLASKREYICGENKMKQCHLFVFGIYVNLFNVKQTH
jgi:hypothetical protein